MEQHQKFSTALISRSSVLNTYFAVNAFPNILAANVPNNIGRNSPFCSFFSFLIVSLISFTSNPDSSSDLSIKSLQLDSNPQPLSS